MKNPRPERGKIIKDIKNLFRLKEEINYITIKYVRSLFKLKQKLNQWNT